ncbi:uncharacterized protein [Nicotiana sylvestris]|uniref:uncharacterized protein n=1 Tax=Nicotiana sylvestris TaxID=4096 RepID=UPI00388CCDF6
MSFLGRLNYISRSIAQSTIICEPIFKMLKKDVATKWTDDCQKAFNRIKEYMSTPPVLVPSEPGSRRMGDQELQILLYLHHVQELRKRFTKTEFQHIPRVQNEFTDALVTLSSMIQHPDKNFVNLIPVKIHDQPAYCAHVEEEADGKPWFHDIKEYLTKREYPKLTKPTKNAHFGGCPTISFTAEIHTDMINVPPNELTATSSPWSFVACGMDVIGPIKPTASNGQRSSYDLMKAMCETFNIRHKNSTAYRPQMNGAVKAANKNIKKILRKMIEKHKQWHEKLSFTLLGYRTTVRTSIGATPYMLVYGTETVIPAEVEIPSLRIIQEVELDDAEWVKSRYEQLALIDGKRMNVVFHGQLYQNSMSRAFNKRVKP